MVKKRTALQELIEKEEAQEEANRRAARSRLDTPVTQRKLEVIIEPLVNQVKDLDKKVYFVDKIVRSATELVVKVTGDCMKLINKIAKEKNDWVKEFSGQLLELHNRKEDFAEVLSTKKNISTRTLLNRVNQLETQLERSERIQYRQRRQIEDLTESDIYPKWSIILFQFHYLILFCSITHQFYVSIIYLYYFKRIMEIWFVSTGFEDFAYFFISLLICLSMISETIYNLSYLQII